MRPGEVSIAAQRGAEYRSGFERIDVAYGDAAAEERLTSDLLGRRTMRRHGPAAAYLSARTSFFDRIVVDAIDRGISQIVVVGAGFDGRSLRYANPAVRWFEVDHPDTQTDKRARLERLAIDSDHVSFVAADFATDRLPAALAGAGHDPDVPTLILCEGVAVYLDEAVLASLLRQLRLIACAGSRLAISLSVSSARDTQADVEHSGRRARFQAAVAELDDPARCTVTADGSADLFATTGWGQLESSRDDSRRQRARHVGLVLVRPI